MKARFIVLFALSILASGCEARGGGGLPPTTCCVAGAPTPAAAATPTSVVESLVPRTETPMQRVRAQQDQAWRELGNGRYGWKPPSTMRRGETERLEAVITQDPNLDIPNEVQGAAAPQIRPLLVSPRMKMELSAESADDFTIIRAAGSDEWQMVVDVAGSAARWQWDVTPLRGGTHSLHLVAIARVGASDVPVDQWPTQQVKTMDAKVQVDVTTAQSVSEWVLGIQPFVASLDTIQQAVVAIGAILAALAGVGGTVRLFRKKTRPARRGRSSR